MGSVCLGTRTIQSKLTIHDMNAEEILISLYYLVFLDSITYHECKSMIEKRIDSLIMNVK